MPKKKDPDWEIVDKLPGEDRPKTESHTTKSPSLFRRRSLWIGLGLGIAIALAFPIVRVILLNLLRAWWLWLAVAIYILWRRGQRRR